MAYRQFAIVMGLLGLGIQTAQADTLVGTYTFSYTGGTQSFTVPSGIQRVEIKAWGAGGGSGLFSSGGGGGFATAIYSVTSGQVISIVVGGAGGGSASGGYNGGGSADGGAGGGGGGSQAFISGGFNLWAGGGAGGGELYGSVGAGGGTSGASGTGGVPGAGGTQSAGGSAGIHGVAGSAGNGGTGANSTGYPGGGGGSGYYGGGGGGDGVAGVGGSGGGGGSSYVSSGSVSSTLTSGSGTAAANSGDADYPGSNIGNAGSGLYVAGFNGYIVLKTYQTTLPPVITSATSESVAENLSTSYQIAANNSPTSFSASSLPTGLSVNTATGLISGTPTVGGTFTSTISATNAYGTDSVSLIWTVAPVDLLIGTYTYSATGSLQTYAIPSGITKLEVKAWAAGGGSGLYSSGGGGGYATAIYSVTSGQSVNIIVGGGGGASATGGYNGGGSAGGGAGGGGGGSHVYVSGAFDLWAGGGGGGGELYGNGGAGGGATGASGTGGVPGSGATSSGGGAGGTDGASGSAGTGGNGGSSTGYPGGGGGGGYFGGGGGGDGVAGIGGAGAGGGSGYIGSGALSSSLSAGSGASVANSSDADYPGSNIGNAGSGFYINGYNGYVVLKTYQTTLPPAVTSATSAYVAQNLPTTYQIAANYGPTSFGATSLPPGLSLNSSTGVISGTPTTAGTFTSTVSATNAYGTGSESLSWTIVAFATLPDVSDFETGSGYAAGNVTGQEYWLATPSLATVSSEQAQAGSYGLKLAGSSTPATASKYFAESGSPAVTFIDLYVKPVAETAAANSSLIQTESAQVGFQLASGQGEIYVFDGVGANQWIGTGSRFDLNGSNQSTGWLHLTIRADYTHHTWDVYRDGKLIEYDLAFSSNTESFFRLLTLKGHTSAAAYFDNITAQSTNPLFTDADKDGMDDAWETAHGLNTSVNDRNSDLDGDGLTNIEEYFLGTDPNNADITPPTSPASPQFKSTTPGSVTIIWSTATDTGSGTHGVAGYNIYRNGVKLNTSLLTVLNYTDTGVSAGSSYTYTVKAVDLAGNISSASIGLFATTPASSTSGTFEVLTPLP